MNTCRVCHETDEPLFKYSVRHYAHIDCGLKKWGAEFFDMLPAFQLKNLPYMPIVNAELTKEYHAKLEVAE